MLNDEIIEIHFIIIIYKTAIYNEYNLHNTKRENKKNNSAVDNFFTQRVNQIALVHKHFLLYQKYLKHSQTPSNTYFEGKQFRVASRYFKHSQK